MWNPPADMGTRIVWVVVFWSIIQLTSMAFVVSKKWPQKKALKIYSVSIIITTFVGTWWATYLPFKSVILITLFFTFLLAIGLIGSQLFIQLRDTVISILIKNIRWKGK